MSQEVSTPIRCSYTIEGSGIPIVLVHGIGARKESWKKVVEELKAGYRCITYDLRGHGQSPLPEEPFGLEELVEDLELLRRDLGIGRMHVMGHSLGGMIAPAYAKKYPERVLSIGLLSTAAFRSEDDKRKVMSIVEAMEQAGVEKMLDALVSRWFTDDFMKANTETVQWRREQVLSTDQNVFLNVFRVYAETEMSSWLSELKIPALVCTGEYDGGCNPTLNQKIAQALPSSKLVILKDLKHAIQLEAPTELALEIKDFLELLHHSS